MSDEARWSDVQRELERVRPDAGVAVGGDPEVLLALLRSLPDGAGPDALLQAAEDLERSTGAEPA